MPRSLCVALLLCCSALLTPARAESQASAPPVMLVTVYHAGDPIDITAFRVSEKFDGVRAWWDGHRLLTRSGTPIAVPVWYTENWPDEVLDGELWVGRCEFEVLSGVVRKSEPVDADWRQVRYLVFDLPTAAGDFDTRVTALHRVIGAIDRPWVTSVEQRRVGSLDALNQLFNATIAAGGEGLMLKRGSSHYQAGRSTDLLKYKPYDDAEAIVIGYTPGKGQFEGLVGALIVRDGQGREFRLGSGLSVDDRRSPPPIGSTVTYAFTGTTNSGLPRFARYLRQRNEP